MDLRADCWIKLSGQTCSAVKLLGQDCVSKRKIMDPLGTVFDSKESISSIFEDMG